MTEEGILVFSKEDLAKLDEIDDIVDRAVTTADPGLVWYYIGGLWARGELMARGIAKALYEMRTRWDIFPSDDEFIDAATQGTGLSAQTIGKAVDYWEFILIPHPELMHLPVGAYHLIVPAAKDGDLDDADWESLAGVASIADVRDIIQAKRGKRTSSEHALVVMLERDGTLKARRGSDAWVSFGYFNLKVEDEAGITAIDRMCRTAGVQKR